MFKHTGFTLIFVTMFSMSLASGQTSSPTSNARSKANIRPTPTPQIASEPFDNADVKTMAAKCVKLETDAGEIEVEMYPETAPATVRNFLNLVSIGAFDTTTFSRVVPGFVIQGGDIWTRDGRVSPDLGQRARKTIPDEPGKILHERGIVSMARADEPNTATTNFFILVDSAPSLDGKFAAFGRVTKGMEAVDVINKAAVEGEKPLKPVRIKRAAISACVTTN